MGHFHCRTESIEIYDIRIFVNFPLHIKGCQSRDEIQNCIRASEVRIWWSNVRVLKGVHLSTVPNFDFALSQALPPAYLLLYTLYKQRCIVSIRKNQIIYD